MLQTDSEAKSNSNDAISTSLPRLRASARQPRPLHLVEHLLRAVGVPGLRQGRDHARVVSTGEPQTHPQQCSPRIQKPLFINMGVSLVLVGIQTTFGGAPTPVSINRGTYCASLTPWEATCWYLQGNHHSVLGGAGCRPSTAYPVGRGSIQHTAYKGKMYGEGSTPGYTPSRHEFGGIGAMQPIQTQDMEAKKGDLRPKKLDC